MMMMMIVIIIVMIHVDYWYDYSFEMDDQIKLVIKYETMFIWPPLKQPLIYHLFAGIPLL